MHECPRIAFTLALITFLSGCILSKDLSQLWSSAGVDESLRGTWEAPQTGSVLSLHFDVGPSNMLCTLTSGDPKNPITLPPTRCRTIKDEETGILFLLFPDSYSVLASYFGGREDESRDQMGMLVPYRMAGDKDLLVYSHHERVLSELIDANDLSGGVLREGGNPPSRQDLRPFLNSPSSASLRLISTSVVNTNAPLMVLKRPKTEENPLPYNSPGDSVSRKTPESGVKTPEDGVGN